MQKTESIRKTLQTYEFRRKGVHFVLGLALVLLINLHFSLMKILLLLMLIVTLCISIYCKYWRPRLIMRFLEIFDKPKDLEKFPAKGAVYYLLGTFVSIMLFDLKTASASVIILAVGDPMAHFIGRYYGKTKLVINNKKLLEGTLAGVFSGTLAAAFFVPWPVAFFGAAFGMMAEAIELETLNLDDNFFIPFVSGIIMKTISMML